MLNRTRIGQKVRKIENNLLRIFFYDFWFRFLVTPKQFYPFYGLWYWLVDALESIGRGWRSWDDVE